MYWLVSLPLGDDSPDRIWSRIQELSTYTYDYSVNFKFKIPENLRVGTLDSLLALSDDLIKVNAAVEGTVNKIRRQLYDLQSPLPEDERSDVWVEGLTPESYLQRFTWNEAKYPSRRPPKDTVQAIMDTVQKLDDDLKVRR
jgi:V-type H+-transporting ATPase subunit C